MSNIKDASLAPSGVKKIEWVRSFMPSLSEIEKQFEKTQPFQGLRIAVSVHLEAKTANLGLVLKKGGAEVYLTGCNPLSTQDDVAAAIAGMGVETFGKYGVTPEEYEELLAQTLACHPHLIVDDGGDLINLLGGRCREYADQLIGGCEETTTGIHRLKARERDGILPCPMMAVNDAKAKHYYDNKYGTGQSVWTAIMDTTNLIVAGKTVVVAGYGWCGKGVAMRAKGMGANVIVTEVDPFKALDATMDGFRIMPMDEAAKYGDIFVTVTGCKDVIVERHFAVMKDQAVLCNAGHFDCEVDVAALRRICTSSEERRKNIVGYHLADGRTLNVLGEGRLVNLACGMGHPAEIMDMSFSVQALSLEWLVKHQNELTKKVYNVPDSIDDE
ncbi:MAG: adenosylhomocysteinase, partial [Blautia sp.]|nr:adenosylhomocysteinase [Blautia sp.]